MSFTVRNNEREAVKAILNDDTYADDDSMANAIIKTVVAQLDRRDSFSYVYTSGGPDPMLTVVWPFWYQKDAERFHKDYGVPPLGGQQQTPPEKWRIYKTDSPERERDKRLAQMASEIEHIGKLRKMGWAVAEETITVRENRYQDMLKARERDRVLDAEDTEAPPVLDAEDTEAPPE